MTWLAFTLSHQALGSSVTPVDAATGSIVGYVLGYGPLGIAALALAYLLFRGWRLLSPTREAELRAAARDEGRADLLKVILLLKGNRRIIVINIPWYLE